MHNDISKTYNEKLNKMFKNSFIISETSNCASVMLDSHKNFHKKLLKNKEMEFCYLFSPKEIFNFFFKNSSTNVY